MTHAFYLWFMCYDREILTNLLLFLSALCELFDKADTGGDGTISIPEYVAMCEEYGIETTEEHINSVKAIANDNGEVYCFIIDDISNGQFQGPEE